MIKDWHLNFQVKNDIAWQSYNVSERACNLITYFSIYEKIGLEKDINFVQGYTRACKTINQ